MLNVLSTLKPKGLIRRQKLADYLSVHIRTMERWLANYKTGGVILMLTDKPKKKESKIISSEIHKGLEQRVNDPHNPFLGYWDAQQWVVDQYE